MAASWARFSAFCRRSLSPSRFNRVDSCERVHRLMRLMVAQGRLNHHAGLYLCMHSLVLVHGSHSCSCLLNLLSGENKCARRVTQRDRARVAARALMCGNNGIFPHRLRHAIMIHTFTFASCLLRSTAAAISSSSSARLSRLACNSASVLSRRLVSC